jgi:cytochrome c6
VIANMPIRWIAALAFASLAGGAFAQTGAPSGAQTGASLFQDNCSACHQKAGEGVKGAFPALAGDKLVQGPADAAAAVVLSGRGGMPTFKDDLSDADIAAILTYVRSSWGNKAPPITPEIVAAARAKAGASASRGLQAH